VCIGFPLWRGIKGEDNLIKSLKLDLHLISKILPPAPLQRGKFKKI
jgi:hypothetical protein